MTRSLLLGLVLLMLSASATADSASRTEQALQHGIASLAERNLSFDDTGDLLNRFYTLQDFSLVWDDEQRLDKLIDALATLEGDGLDPDHYGLQALRAYRDAPPRTHDEKVCRDILASHAWLQGLVHLTRGRLDPETLQPLWRFGGARRAPSPEMIVLRSVSAIEDAAQAFDEARPTAFGYRTLRQALLDLKTQSADTPEPPRVPEGRLLRRGDRDERISTLRERLTQAGYSSDEAGNNFDESLDTAVRRFQEDHALSSDGIVGPATLGVLNISDADRIDQLRINLERRRWLAHEMEPRMLLVDIAGAEIQYFRNGESVWKTRSQVGRPSRRTPALRSEITHFTFNPTWTVPPTIFRKDKLPEIRRDIDYLARNRLRVIDHSGRQLLPEQVNWNNPQGIMLRQDAGPDNALGRVAIRFPNPFSVYLHDTPNQRLFERDRRTFSSGCVRVENALSLVDLLIEDDGGIDQGHVTRALDSGHTRNISLAEPVPVLMAYWTVNLSEDGSPRHLQDVYDRDGAVLEALNRIRELPPMTLRCDR